MTSATGDSGMYESGTRTGEDALIRNIIHHWKLRPSCLLSLAHTPGTTPVPATMTRADEATVADRPRTYPANLTTLTGSPVEALNSPTPTHVGSTATPASSGVGLRTTLGAALKGQRRRREAMKISSRVGNTRRRSPCFVVTASNLLCSSSRVGDQRFPRLIR